MLNKKIIIFLLLILITVSFSVNSIETLDDKIIIKDEVIVKEEAISYSTDQKVKVLPVDSCLNNICKVVSINDYFYKKYPINNGTGYLTWSEGVKISYFGDKLIIVTSDGVECNATLSKTIIPTKTTDNIKNVYEITNVNLTDMVCNEKIDWIIKGKTGTVSHYYFDLDPIFRDDNSTDWGSGTYVNTTTQDNKLILNSNNLTGTFTSQIFDAGGSSSWDNISCDGLEDGGSSEITNYCGAGATSGGLGIAWSNPTRIYASDTLFATTPIEDYDDYSEVLQATNFGFTIPIGATINGVTMKFEGDEATGSDVEDRNIQLIKGGSLTGNDKSNGGWSSVWTIRTYGGSNDMWGVTLTPSDVNSANFGVGISVTRTGTYGYAYIDYVTITINYTTSSNISYSVMSCNDDACSGESFTENFECDNVTNSLSLNNNQWFRYEISMTRDVSSLEPNVTSVTINYNTLNTAPTVNLISPADQFSTFNTLINFTFNFTDPEEDNASCELKLDGVGFGVNSTTLNNTNAVILSNHSISVGRYNWTITCDDGSSGITESSPREIEILPIPPPHIVISMLEADDWFNGALWTNDLTPDVKATIIGLYPPFNCTMLLDNVPKGSIGSIANNTITTFTFNESLAFYIDYDNQLSFSCDNIMGTNNVSSTETIYTFNATGGGGLISCISVLGIGCGVSISNNCAVINQ